MPSPPESTSLALLQQRFAEALRAPQGESDRAVAALAVHVREDGLEPAGRVRVYRNNAQAMFEGALERTYPVLRRRVGDGYFRGLAVEYRAAHPSRSGDLHWVGQSFPGWLSARLAGSEYAWLADLARLEWACEEALVAGARQPLGREALARVAPESLADTHLVLQPHVRLVSSPYPVWSVWQANQPGESGRPVDFSIGAQHVVIACGADGLVLHSVPEGHFLFVAALAAGATLGEAVDRSSVGIEQLPGLLGWLFADALVVETRGPADAPWGGTQ